MLKRIEIRPWYWLICVFSIALIPNFKSGDSLYWETANALGFVAFAGFLILLVNGYSKSGFSHFHRWFGIAVLVAVLAHASWFLLADTAVLEYVKPGAPPYMVFGLSALLFTLLLIFTSVKRTRRASYFAGEPFRFWHNWQSILVVVLSALHILLSGFYFVSNWQWVLLVVVVILSFVVSTRATTSRRGERKKSLKEFWWLMLLCFVLVLAFVFLRWSSV